MTILFTIVATVGRIEARTDTRTSYQEICFHHSQSLSFCLVVSYSVDSKVISSICDCVCVVLVTAILSFLVYVTCKLRIPSFLIIAYHPFTDQFSSVSSSVTAEALPTLPLDFSRPRHSQNDVTFGSGVEVKPIVSEPKEEVHHG